MILRNPTSMSSLKNKISPSGDILAHILTMTFLATRRTHYVVNPKHDWLIGTILLFATKKAKMDLHEKLTTMDLKQKADHCGFKQKADHRGFKRKADHCGFKRKADHRGFKRKADYTPPVHGK